MQNCLVYISRNENYLGCGVLVEDAVILTCRHVVKQAAPGETFTIRFPNCTTPAEQPFETMATIIDTCDGGQPQVDLVILQPQRRPPKLIRLQLAMGQDYETGEAYVVTAVVLRPNAFPDSLTEMSGEISRTFVMPVTHCRKFTGKSEGLRLLSGTSGSPVFIRNAQHLAGIIVRATAENTQNSDAIRESLFLPASLIAPHLERALKTLPEFMLLRQGATETQVWPDGRAFKL